VFADRFPEPDEGLETAAGEAGEEPVDQVADGLDGQAGREDRADHLLHRPGAGDLPAARLDLGERGGLLVGEIGGVLEQRPAVVLELEGRALLAGLAQIVPVRAADLVQRLGRELDDVVVVDHDRGLRRALTHALGVAAGHVHRDRGQSARAREDRGLELGSAVKPCALDAVADGDGRARTERDHDRWFRGLLVRPLELGRGRVERVEELISGGLTLALAAPHHPAAAVITDERQVPMALAPRDLIDRDLEQSLETVAIELLVSDSLDHPPDRVPVDPGQPAGRGLVGLGRQPRDQVIEVAGEPGTVASERHALHQGAVLGTDEPPQPAADLQPPTPEIKMAPAGIVILLVLTVRRGERALRTHKQTTTQRHNHDHPVGLEAHRADPDPG
jgi:hypothetical protein